jgi:hypothetical protein
MNFVFRNLKVPKKKTRVRVVEYFIEAARECFNIGEFWRVKNHNEAFSLSCYSKLLLLERLYNLLFNQQVISIR